MMLDELFEKSWAFQEMRQKAYEQSYKQGYEQGCKEVIRQDLLLFVEAYFPSLVQLAQNVCNTIQALDELEQLFEKALNAKDEQEARQILLSAQK